MIAKASLYGRIVDGKLVIEKTKEQYAAEAIVAEAALDPVKYELFSHSLFQLLEECREVVRRIGISPLVRYCGECMFAVYTADGDAALTASSILLHIAGNAYVVRYILKEHADELKEGDHWISNDPFIGGTHLHDHAIVSPVFHKGELVAWIGSLTHIPEVGAIEAGASPAARERFHEGLLLPAVKIVDGGVQRRDIWRLLQRSGREAHTVTIDNVAKIAGNTRARQRFLELVETYGVDFVKVALRRLILDSEKLARDKIKKVQDGEYFGRIFMDNDGGGQDVIWHVDCTATVDGENLTLDYSGTSPQNRGPCNCAPPGMLGGVFSTLCGQFFYDAHWNQGLLNAVKVILPEKTVINPSENAAVGFCPAQPAEATANATLLAIDRMRLASGLEIDDINAPYAVASGGINLAGTDQFGRPLASANFDHMGAGFGAKHSADGVDSGGRIWAPEADCSEVEVFERWMPLLYLSRGHIKDGYGFGMFRGGSSIQKTIVIHRPGEGKVLGTSWAGGQMVSISPGFAGGYPSARACFLLAQGTDFYERASSGERLPHSGDELLEWQDDIRVEELRTPGPHRTFFAGDILYHQTESSGGLGDPLLRDPEAVVLDIRSERLSKEVAESVYGVAVDMNHMTVDQTRTESLREAIRQRRLARGRRFDKLTEGPK